MERFYVCIKNEGPCSPVQEPSLEAARILQSVRIAYPETRSR